MNILYESTYEFYALCFHILICFLWINRLLFINWNKNNNKSKLYLHPEHLRNECIQNVLFLSTLNNEICRYKSVSWPSLERKRWCTCHCVYWHKPFWIDFNLLHKSKTARSTYLKFSMFNRPPKITWNSNFHEWTYYSPWHITVWKV